MSFIPDSHCSTWLDILFCHIVSMVWTEQLLWVYSHCCQLSLHVHETSICGFCVLHKWSWKWFFTSEFYVFWSKMSKNLYVNLYFSNCIVNVCIYFPVFSCCNNSIMNILVCVVQWFSAETNGGYVSKYKVGTDIYKHIWQCDWRERLFTNFSWNRLQYIYFTA